MKKNLLWMALPSLMFLFGSCEKTDLIENEIEIKVETEYTEPVKNQLYVWTEESDKVDVLTDGKEYLYFVERDTLTQGQIIKGSRFDSQTSKWSETEANVAYIDSLGRMTSLVMDGAICNFYNYTESTCDIALIHADGTIDCYENVSIPDNNSRNVSSRNDETISNTLSVVSIVRSSVKLAMEICENPKTLNTAFAAWDYLNDIIGGGVKFVSSTASMGTQFKLMNLKPDLFSLLVYLIESGRTLSDFLTEQLIGNWELELVDVHQVSAHAAEATFMISGIKDDSVLKKNGSIWYKNTKSNDANAIPFEVKNDSYKMMLPLNSHGTFTGTVTLSANYGFFIQKNFKFNAYYLSLKNVHVDEEALFVDGKVRFNLALNIEGDESTFKGISQFGYYITYEGNTPEYFELKNLKDYQLLPKFHTFAAGREMFFEKDIDYTNFTAELTGYQIGVYVYDKGKGLLYTFDERPLEGMIYKRKPKFEISNIQILDRGATDDPEGRDRYITYSVDYTMDGSFFLKSIHEYYGSNWTNSGESYKIAEDFNDGQKITLSSSVSYSSKNHHPSYISFMGLMTNGSTHAFQQGMVFQDGNMSLATSGEGRAVIESRSVNSDIVPMMIIKK